MVYLLKMVIFYSYVSLPEGIWLSFNDHILLSSSKGCCGQTLAVFKEQARKDAITLPWWHRHCSLTFVAHSCLEKSYRLSIWAQLFSVKHMSRILPSQQYESHLGPSSKVGMDKQNITCMVCSAAPPRASKRLFTHLSPHIYVAYPSSFFWTCQSSVKWFKHHVYIYTRWYILTNVYKCMKR